MLPCPSRFSLRRTQPGRFTLTSLVAGAVLVASASGLAVAKSGASEPAEWEAEMTTLSGNYLAARIATGARDNRSAARFLERALAADPDNPVLLDRALSSEIATGNIDKGLVIAKQLVLSEPSHRLARLALGLDAMRTRDYTGARRHMEAMQSGTLADLTSGLIDAWAIAGQGDTDAALTRIDEITGPEWYLVFKDLNRGLISELAGRIDDARRYLDIAYTAESSTLWIVEARARIEARNGNRDGAVEILNSFDAALPDHPQVIALRTAIQSGDRIGPMVETPVAGAHSVLLGLGMALALQGGEDFAISYLQLALNSDQPSPLGLATLADLYERLQKYEEANLVYDRFADDAPLKFASEIKRATNLNSLDEVEESIALLEALIAERPTDLEAISALGNVQRSREMFAEAAVTYSRAVDQIGEPERKHWSLFYFRGIAFERSKQWDEAEADLLEALVLSPEHPLVLNYLGYSWVDQNVNLEEGLDMIRRAVARRPRDGYIVDSLGWAYYRLGRYEEAVEQLERAVELRPEDPVINDHLGDAYWKVGRTLEAGFQWSHARDLDPEPDALEIILDKLENGLPEDDANRLANDDGDKDG